MSFARLYLFLSLLLSVFSSLARAGEGLFTTSAPAAIERAKPSVFLLVARERTGSESFIHGGTAFVIRRFESAGQVVLDLLTARHVIEGRCAADGSCPGLTLYQNPRITVVDSFFDFKRAGLGVGGVTLIAIAKSADLAVIRVTQANREGAAGGGGWNSVRPLNFANAELRKGEAAFAIGFPLLFLRDGASDHPTWWTKRWTRGELSERLSEKASRFSAATDASDANYLGLTLDGMIGLSGGPVLNEAGEVAGVYKASGANDGNDNAYVQDGLPHSAAVSLAAVREFLITLP